MLDFAFYSISLSKVKFVTSAFSTMVGILAKAFEAHLILTKFN